MNSEIAMRLASDMLWMSLKLALPLLLATLVVGLVISILQVVTQIQEMSLTFVPKLIVAVLVLVVGGPWLMRTATQYSVQLISNIPSYF